MDDLSAQMLLFHYVLINNCVLQSICLIIQITFYKKKKEKYFKIITSTIHVPQVPPPPQFSRGLAWTCIYD